MKKKRRSDIAFENALFECLKTTTIDKIRVEELCDKSGYSRACFYQNYGSKENLCNFIVENEAEKYHEMLSLSSFNPLDPESLEKSINVVTDYFEYVKSNSLLYSYIVNDSFKNGAYKTIVEKLRYNQDAAIAIPKCQSSADKLAPYCHTLQRYTYGVCYFAMRKWILNDFSIPRRDLRILCQYTVLLPYYKETREI